MRAILRGRRPNVRKLAEARDARRLVAALGYRDPVVDSHDRVYDLGTPVRRDAALALASLPDADGVDIGEALVKALGDSSEEVRQAVAAALGARRDQKAVPALGYVALSWDDPRYVAARAAAARALVALSGPDSVQTFTKLALQNPGQWEHAREIIADMVAQGGDETAAGARAVAVDALQGDDEIAERAVDVLVLLGAQSVEPLLDVLGRGSVSPSIVRGLGDLGDMRASPALIEFLTSADSSMRRAAAEALGEIADPSTAESLLAATADHDHQVRGAALQALHKLGPVAPALTAVNHEHADGDDVSAEPRHPVAPPPTTQSSPTPPPAYQVGPPQTTAANGSQESNGRRRPSGRSWFRR